MAQVIKLIFRKKFKKHYEKLPSELQTLFDGKLKAFIQNPFHKSFATHKYKTKKTQTVYEAYLTHSYRFTFEIGKNYIIFRNIGSHSIIDKGQV